ncbi:DNA polymerase III subunit epsilon [Paeniglutamicibacter sp. ABSL32-1]|uniref:exonuclease domain-containing protein n=1 Tax=Paeniglutamicibacter quisquiliarum TaxID=2849498 RepID=UPI001C2DDDAB|nr:exonuclease domain-containing protein [Paeniglutamicibacter quisquiliarum]MBV1779254.1 DNA polymerase III subunit epsilon [Paeniglutamicibacter quisquiliarum]
MALGHFAVIDTETTGLFPGNHDRIAEIAVITMDRSGTILDRWETLINPERDLGKQSIHGIRAKDILGAPRFGDIAQELDWRLSGTLVVAHNLRFDARFLGAEFHRAGLALPGFFLPRGLCTMQMAHEYLPGAGRSLQDCCDSFGIELHHAHSAGDDAEAAAVLLSRYMELDPDLGDWDFLLSEAATTAWRPSPPSGLLAPALRSSADSRETHFVERIVVRLPEVSGPVEHQDYLALLDRALLDRYLSAHEQSALVALADELGISQATVRELHARYFASVSEVAWSDGVLTDEELNDLTTIAEVLCIPGEQLEAVSQRRQETTPHVPGSEAASTAFLEPGDLIVLTGDMSRPRDAIEAELESAGFRPHGAVTKKVKLLVAADPDSLSGKARKARSYGIPVVGEDYLWGRLLHIPDN